MNREEIGNKIKQLIIRELELEGEYTQEDITDDFLVNFHINSIDALDLLLQIEGEFDVELPDESFNAQTFESVDNVIQIIQELLEE